MAVAGDLGIAISLAAEGSLVRSKLGVKLSEYANADEVSSIAVVTPSTDMPLDHPQES